MDRYTVFTIWFLISALNGIKCEKPTLYYFLPSPPCRTVLMTASVLGSDLNLKILNVAKGEQFSEEFLKINPQHTVPTLVDNGFAISESRSIAAYLTTLSPKGEKLYPKDPKKRALVDQMMYFDTDKFYKRVLNRFVFEPDATPMVAGAPYDKNKGDLLDSTFGMLDQYLTRGTWVAGNEMTIADIVLLTTVSLAEACGYQVSRYQKVNRWLTNMKTMVPQYHELNEVGIEMWLNASIPANKHRRRKHN